MVLDKLINPQLLRNRPYLAVPTGFMMVVIALFSTAVVFPAEYSVIVVAFASLLTLPYVMKIFELDELNIDLSDMEAPTGIDRQKLEAWVRKCLRDGYTPKQVRNSLIENNLEKDVQLLHDLGMLDDINDRYLRESSFLSRHSRTVEFYCLLFLGMFLAFMTMYMMSGEIGRENFFKHQLTLIYGRGIVTSPTQVYGILATNLKILLLCVFLSLFFGAGAILILTYNASIAGVLYGGFLDKAFAGDPLSLVVAYLPHTTLEIFAYLLASISGSILSKSAAEVEPGSKRLLFKDGIKYLLLSLAILLIAGLVEVIIPMILLK